MEYRKIVEARFLERPNRFIAHVLLDGKIETVHVKNTGRCRELLVKGCQVFLEKADNPNRKTGYDLVAVKKKDRLINMDSTAPNIVVGEWLSQNGLYNDVVQIKPETTYGSSRFDFYVETKTQKIFLEVKGVTLEENQVVRFPDAPSQRAVKHIQELVKAKKEGYEAVLLFVVQMKDVLYFTPNVQTHPEFGKAVREAAKEGVKVLSYDCDVWESGMKIRKPVKVVL